MRYFVIFIFPLLSLSAEIRVLTDINGRAIEATLIWKTDDTIKILRNDGSEFNVPLELLSREDQLYLKSWSPPLPEPLANPIDGVVIIRSKSGDGVGTGFFVFDGGKYYIYTNQHVIADPLSLEFLNSRGALVKLGALEVSNSIDLARFRVSPHPAFTLTDDVLADSKITVLGNSLGAGVVTSSKGRIRGIGPQEIEVDSDFVQGNSGGPVIDSLGRVIGVATYIRRGDDKPNWVKENTRYTETRRFTVRPSRVNDWKQIGYADYTKQTRALASTRYKFEQCLWTYQMLAEGAGYISTLPTSWERDIIQILRNHNARQSRPDSTRTTYYVDGFPVSSSTKSHRDEKESSRRANLRALDQYIQREFGDLYMLRNSTLDIDYLLKGLFGAENLMQEIALLRSEIEKSIALSSRR
jgi:hypothetical protein